MVSHSQFSERELQAITEIASQPDPFALVVASMCPGIFGHEMVKAGLILGLFGGTNTDLGGNGKAESGTPVTGSRPGIVFTCAPLSMPVYLCSSYHSGSFCFVIVFGC